MPPDETTHPPRPTAAAATAGTLRAVLAQSSGQVRRIGVLMGPNEGSPEGQARIAAFREGLRSTGWIEGGNLQLDVRWAGGDMGRMRALAGELVASNPAAILANGTPAVTALKERTSSIPIIFAQIQDPVGLGYVASLGRPGGNISGFAMTVDFGLIGKWLQMLKAVAPSVTRAMLLFNPETVPFYRRYFGSPDPSLAPLGIALTLGEVSAPQDISKTLASDARRPGRQPSGAARFVHRHASSPDRRAGQGVSAALDLGLSPVRRLWRPARLWPRHPRHLPPLRDLYRPRAEGRQPCRAPGPGADQVRDRGQPQDRGGARPQIPADILASADEVIE